MTTSHVGPAARPPWLKLADGRVQIAKDPGSIFAIADLIRRTEEEILRLFSEGLVAGTTHTCIGQEICQLAVVRALAPEDHVLSSHRNHGHLLTYCGDVGGLFAEVCGREGALCGGRGGSQHIAVGRFHSNGVQGGLAGIAVGLALGERLRSSTSIVALIIGDGTLGQGLVYEAMNLAGIWSLPVLIVVENNAIAQTTPTISTIAGDIVARGQAFGLKCWRLEDNAADFVNEVERAVQWVREARRPAMLVIDTARLGPHSKGDDLRSPEEIARIRARDPMMALRRKLEPERAQSIETRNAAFVKAVSVDVMNRREAPVAEPRTRALMTNAKILTNGQTGLSVREGLNASLRRLLTEDDRVILLGQDLHDPYGGAFKVTAGLSTDFEGRVLSTPISEGGITGAAIGLALNGFRPILEIMFADFLSLCVDQLYNQATKLPLVHGEETIALVVRAPSGGRRGYGPTHSQSPEALIAAIPGMTVVCLHHRLDAGQLLETAVRYAAGPLLFVEHKLLYGRTMDSGDYAPLPAADEHGLDRLFPTLARLREAPDIVIVTHGGILAEVEQAVQHLEDSEELSVEVLVPSLLAPLPSAGLIGRIRRCDRLLVVEEGPVFLGLGAEILARCNEAGIATKARRLGMNGVIIPAARHLEARVIPGVDDIIAAAVSLF